jgi:fluoroacetyl-CoA thioesterase
MMLKGRTAEVRLAVSSPYTAEPESRSPRGSFPAVLPISRLTALMELAAVRLMQPDLGAAETSIAIEMNVTHAAPAQHPSANVRAVASYRGIVGRLHHFNVNVFDETGLIASAEHTRAVVIEHRLLGIARRRAGRRSMQLAI